MPKNAISTAGWDSVIRAGSLTRRNPRLKKLHALNLIQPPDHHAQIPKKTPGLFTSYNTDKPANKEKPTAKKTIPPAAPQRKLAGRYAFLALAFLAVITGSLSGLILVYSAELPQIHDLERYRPSTTTDLYDQKGRLIGSFALERRVIVNYEDLSPTLRQAVISIEDKSFESHWGINVFRVAGAFFTTFAAKAAGRALPH